MKTLRQHLDTGSLVVMAITLALFLVAVFLKGLTHDLLLEAGVFLVSVKLILLSYKANVSAQEMKGQLEEIRALLADPERRGAEALRRT